MTTARGDGGVCRALAALALALATGLGACAASAQPLPEPERLAQRFATEVDKRLELPPQEAAVYTRLTVQALVESGTLLDQAQYLVVVDRHPQVQALLLAWYAPGEGLRFLGASPVSTGLPGRFDHFKTPLGVFAHSLANPDFRAEGSRNSNGIRGYGVKGMRVFDFGWQQAGKGWGKDAGRSMVMRLQMHATDPDRLERRLGSAQSKGCVRIPATLNRLLDRLAVLDADYLHAPRGDRRLWVLPKAAEPVARPGRYLVVVESQRDARPAWAGTLVAPAAAKPADARR